MDKLTFDEKIETERLILKPPELTFEFATMVYNLIKENWEYTIRFLDRVANIKAPEDEYAFFAKMNKKWKDMDAHQLHLNRTQEAHQGNDR